MAPEPRLLIFAAAVLVEIVEACLANGHDARMRGLRHDLAERDIALLAGLVGMRPHRAAYIREALRNAQNLGEFPHPRADREHMTDAGAACPRNNIASLGIEVRKIQMTMAID